MKYTEQDLTEMVANAKGIEDHEHKLDLQRRVDSWIAKGMGPDDSKQLLLEAQARAQRWYKKTATA